MNKSNIYHRHFRSSKILIKKIKVNKEHRKVGSVKPETIKNIKKLLNCTKSFKNLLA